MLEAIKNQINQKREFLESATIIFEDAVDTALDDLIILEEAPEETDLEKETEEPKKDEPQAAEEPKDDETPSTDEPGTDLLDTPINSTDDPPAPASIPAAAVGAPMDDEIEDLLNTTIDLKSNTLSDILPVPPANAAEAIQGDDILNTRVDDGFGDEPEAPEPEDPEPDPVGEPGEAMETEAPEEEQVANEAVTEAAIGNLDASLSRLSESQSEIANILNETVGSKEDPDLEKEKKDAADKAIDTLNKGSKAQADTAKEIEDKVKKEAGEILDDPQNPETPTEGVTLTEAISLGDDPTAGDAAAAPSSDTPPDEAPAEDSTVTAAVKDKVAESETTTSSVAPMDGGGASKEELLKKLGNITKNLEDAKQAVMQSLA